MKQQGHQGADGYPVCLVWEESQIVRTLDARSKTFNLYALQMAVSLPYSKKAGENFQALMSQLAKEA